MKWLSALLLVLPLTACGSADPGPGGVTPGEAQALDEAAQMIEQRRLPDDVVRPPAVTPTPASTIAAPVAPPG